MSTITTEKEQRTQSREGAKNPQRKEGEAMTEKCRTEK